MSRTVLTKTSSDPVSLCETAPDATFFKSEDVILEGWRRQIPLGKCGHDVLQYTINFCTVANPLKAKPRRNPRYTSISWRKVKWEEFNNEVDEAYVQYVSANNIPTNQRQQVHYFSKAIRHAYTTASKTLPKGCRPDPIMWYTAELEKLMDARNDAWQIWRTTGLDADKRRHEQLAKELQIKLREAKTKAWREFATDLSYVSNASKVMRVIQSINRSDESVAPNVALLDAADSTGYRRPLTTDKQKARRFREVYAETSKSPSIPRTRIHRREFFNRKNRVRQYILHLKMYKTRLLQNRLHSR